MKSTWSMCCEWITYNHQPFLAQCPSICLNTFMLLLCSLRLLDCGGQLDSCKITKSLCIKRFSLCLENIYWIKVCRPTCHETGMTLDFRATQFVQKRPQVDLSDAELPFTCQNTEKSFNLQSMLPSVNRKLMWTDRSLPRVQLSCPQGHGDEAEDVKSF